MMVRSLLLMMKWVRYGMLMLLLRSARVLLMRALLSLLMMMWVEGVWRAGNVAGTVPAAIDEGAAAVVVAERGHMECMALLRHPLELL